MDALTPLPLDPALAGARIQGVQQPDTATVLLETHRTGVGAARWRFDVGAETARLMRTFQRTARGDAARGDAGRGEATRGAPPVFCQWLRTRLLGGRVDGLVLRHPQLVQLTVLREGEPLHLLLELNRRDSNLLLLDAADRLLIALRHPSLPGRSLGSEQPYLPPPRMHAWPRGVPLAERYPAPDEAAARALEQGWLARERELAFLARREPARQAVRRELKRLTRRLEQMQADRAAAAESEQWRRYGELLQIHRDRLRRGLAEVQVPDVFAPDAPLVTIPLDAQAEPGENIARCFRQFRKRRDAAPHAEGRIAETQAALDAWRGVQATLDAAETQDALAALRDALPAAAARLGPLLRGDAPARRKGQPRAAEGPLRRFSAEGYEILVGRSREENDRLTFRLGRGRDWWLHVQGHGGSHVLVRNPSGAALPPRTLREAAWLAAYYSQVRAAGTVEVDHTQRKHVRRLPGGEPGQVLFTHDKSVLIRLDDPELRQVLQRTDANAG